MIITQSYINYQSSFDICYGGHIHFACPKNDQFWPCVRTGMRLIDTIIKPFTVRVFEADSLVRSGQCFEVSFLLHVIQTYAKKWQHHAKNLIVSIFWWCTTVQSSRIVTVLVLTQSPQLDVPVTICEVLRKFLYSSTSFMDDITLTHFSILWTCCL